MYLKSYFLLQIAENSISRVSEVVKIVLLQYLIAEDNSS